MDRIKALDWYQKGILLLLAFCTVIFAAVYFVTTARVGYEYHNEILIPGTERYSMVYSGKIQGKQACFTVYADKTVEFQYGDQIYGPYTAKEDPTAIPQTEELSEDLKESMVGVELYRDEEIIFRGAILEQAEPFWLYNEDGTLEGFESSVMTDYGIVMDENGNVIDPMEPSVATILELMMSPELTHKGDWGMWRCGVLLCIITVIFILFADELFYLNLIFRIQNAEFAEPSEWAIMCRYISWTILTIMAIVTFIMGLQ